MVRVMLALALVAASARADDAPCLASVSLEPAQAVVGQQVLYRVRILRRTDVSNVTWVDPPSFPSLRAEWLPGTSPDPGIGDVSPHRLVYEERRALFPARSGDLEIPAARLACSTGDGTGEPVEVEVPGARLRVEPLPSHGRPADFSGVVGPIEIASSVSAERVGVGETVSLSVTVSGAGNSWAAAPGLPQLDGVDVHPRPPSLTLDAGRVLVARRSFPYELVPRREGSLVVPPLHVSWYDPEAGAYRVSEAPALEVRVDPEPPLAGPRLPEPAPADRPLEGSGGGWRWALGGALALAAAATCLSAVRIAMWRRAPRRAAAPHLARAAQAFARGDAGETSAALAAALRAGLDARLPGTRALSAEEILARGSRDQALREAADALARLDRARFARRAEDPPDVQRVEELVRHL